jgi:hypothetical protein
MQARRNPMKLSLHQMEGNNSKNLSNDYQNDLLEVLNVQKNEGNQHFSLSLLYPYMPPIFD